MEPTLSVLAPVYNAQRTLSELVSQWIEILPEMTRHFELLLIDDGSTDATLEVAHELAVHYPQIGVVGHPARLGPAMSVRSGLVRTTGEMVLIRSESCRLDLYDLPRLWRHAGEHDILIARPPARAGLGWIPRAPLGMPPVGGVDERPGLMLLHRRVTRGWLTLGGHEELIVHLARRGYPMLEVELRERESRDSLAPLAEQGGKRIPVPTMTGGKTMIDTSFLKGPPTKELKRPNYLDRIKAFALGE